MLLITTFFVPYQQPSFDIQNNVIEICYYHDEDKYHMMYIDDDLINAPIIRRCELEEWYVYDHRMRLPFMLKHMQIKEN